MAGVAADVDDPSGAAPRIVRATSSWIPARGGSRITTVGPTVALDERLVEHVLHVSRVERRIVDAVEARVGPGVLDRFGHVLDADHSRRPGGDEVGYRARARVQVVDGFLSGQRGELADYLVQFVSLGRVGLVERFRPDLETRLSISSKIWSRPLCGGFQSPIVVVGVSC